MAMTDWCIHFTTRHKCPHEHTVAYRWQHTGLVFGPLEQCVACGAVLCAVGDQKAAVIVRPGSALRIGELMTGLQPVAQGAD